MRTFARIAILAAFIAGLSSPPAGTASTRSIPDLPVSYVFATGKLARLQGGVTYRASAFPIALRVTPPDRSWGGAQWKANVFAPTEIAQRHLKCSTTPAVCRPPYYGWVTIGPAGTYSQGPPRALIVILTGFSRVPSVAATVANLHRGGGVDYQPTSQVKVAGFSGTQFDGETAGAKHFFIAFTPPSRGAAGSGAADLIEMNGPGHPFRFVVLNVRGKTVVVLLGSLVLSADQFPAFLAKSNGILGSLRFPR
jgi:hypothetical protein